MNVSRNNLFLYATSELSQDAFICWLLSWALEDTKTDVVLQECARKVLEAFIPELRGRPFALKEIRRQWEHMDILLTVESGNKTYKVVVEDKTTTKEHSNQLKKYLKALSAAFPDCLPRGVYFKTGFQCDLSQVEAAGYEIVMRSRILELIAPYISRTENSILQDYYEYWNGWHQESLRYQTLPVAKWEPIHICAFYDALKQSCFAEARNAWLGYGYVANPAGGFDGLWTGLCNNIVEVFGAPCELYLQIEPEWDHDIGGRIYPVCLKISWQGDLPSHISARDVRNAIAYDQSGEYRLSAYGFKKPKRYGFGQHMTLGTFFPSCEDAGQLTAALAAAFENYKKLLRALIEQDI